MAKPRPTRALAESLAPDRPDALRGAILGLLHDRTCSDLTIPQIAVLMALEGQSRPALLADELAVGRSTITRALARLEKLSLVARQMDKQDRRQVTVTRLPAGTRLLERLARDARKA